MLSPFVAPDAKYHISGAVLRRRTYSVDETAS